MELKNYIEAGIEKAGTGRELARRLEIGANEITDAKGHRRGLPVHAAVKLADYIEADLRPLIAANELVTEKKAEKRAYWQPIAQAGRAAVAAMSFFIVINTLAPPPTQASASLETPKGRSVLC